MDGREIPGFYFDREKGKYFRITAASRAGPDYKYTKENIKKQKREEKAERLDSHRAKRRKTERVVSRHAKNFLSQAYLQREIGYARRSYYQQSVWAGACVAGWGGQYVFPGGNRHFAVRYFDRSATSDYLYFNFGEHDVRRWGLPDSATVPAPDSDERHVVWETVGLTYQEDLTRMTSPVSSLNYLPASGALVVTTYGSDRPPVVYLTDPERDGPYVGEQFTPRNCTTIWTSTPKPTFFVSDPGTSVPATATEHIAVGASADLQLYSRSPAGSWDCSTLLKSSSDIFSLCWLDEKTLMLGQRDGKMKLYDTRSAGSVGILSHSTPVNQIRRADDFSRVVVSGLCDTLCVYDIRSGASDSKSTQPTKKRGRKNGLPFPSSPYTQRFSGFKNAATTDLGMDVCERLGLVAAAGEDEHLKVWNLYTGELVRTLGSAENMANSAVWKETQSGKGVIRCVRFVEGEDGDVSLWASVGGGVMKFGWDCYCG